MFENKTILILLSGGIELFQLTILKELRKVFTMDSKWGHELPMLTMPFPLILVYL